MTQSPRRNDGTFSGALREAQDADLCHSVEFRDKQGHAAQSRGTAHPKLVEFERRLIRHMRGLNVPLYSEVFWDTDAVDIIHVKYGWNIPEKAWAIIGHMGKEIAARSVAPDYLRDEKGKIVQTTRYNFRWGGDMTRYAPSYWKMTACIE